MGQPNFCLYCGTPLESRALGGFDRAICPSEECNFIHWGNPTPVVAAVIVSEQRDEALLVRNVGWPEKVFALVTGFLEKEEQPEDAVAREVKEETSLEAIEVNWLGNYAFAAKNQLLLGYEVRVDRTADIELNEELVESKWIPADKLKAWPFGTGDAVRDWIARHVEK
jgi:NAD+ diphosphatase